MKKNNRFCPKCGAPIRQGEKFCRNCGYNLQRYFHTRTHSHTHLPVVKKRSHASASLKPLKKRMQKHLYGWLTGILVILLLLVGGYVADHRNSIGGTSAQTLTPQLPRYSWVVTAKNDAGGMNDTLLFLFNGRQVTINPAVPPILKICDELSSDRDVRDKINLGVQKSTAHYKIDGDALKINGHKSIRHVKKVKHHYEFTVETRGGRKVEMIMTKYHKIHPKLTK